MGRHITLRGGLDALLGALQRRRHRVFCASLADIFDLQAPAGAHEDLWTLIRETPSLDWQLLTKRPQNIVDMLPDDWSDGWPNVWRGTTTEDQETYDARWPILAAVPAAVHFVSDEPAIGRLDLFGYDRFPDWLIWGGGESGPGARPMLPSWASALTHQCVFYGVAVFGKQWGSYASNPIVVEGLGTTREAERLDPRSNGKGGALLDGRLWREFPGGHPPP